MTKQEFIEHLDVQAKERENQFHWCRVWSNSDILWQVCTPPWIDGMSEQELNLTIDGIVQIVTYSDFETKPEIQEITYEEFIKINYNLR